MRHSASWKWWVSGLLLLATMINYMDRQTLANLSVRITEEFKLSQEEYGNIEFVFGWGFAIGSLAFGILADRISVRVLYPLVLLGWSAMGFITGVTDGYAAMLACRALLGFFEAGHWPCALRTTQCVLSRSDRMMGNSVLQSGASLGAIFTPLIGGSTTGLITAALWRYRRGSALDAVQLGALIVALGASVAHVMGTTILIEFGAPQIVALGWELVIVAIVLFSVRLVLRRGLVEEARELGLPDPTHPAQRADR